MRAVPLVACMLLTAALAGCRKAPEQPAPVPPISVAEPPRLIDRLPGVTVPRPVAQPTPSIDPNLALAQSVRGRLQAAFGTQGAPLLEVTVGSGVVTITARPGSNATRAQVQTALAGLAGATRVDSDALPP